MMRTLCRGLLVLGGIPFALLISASAMAQSEPQANGGEWGPVIAELLLLLVVAACLLTLFRIYVAVRGGRIAQCWFWFVLGFGVLGLAQFVLFAGRLGLFHSPDFWVTAIRTVAMVILFIGATRMKRLLT
jgi:phosphoglycerol transferase MdoB-like AlkP superfamily enzyme